MNKLSYEVVDMTELENVLGGSELQMTGCGIANGRCTSTEGGCGLFNGKCGGTVVEEPKPTNPGELITPVKP